MGVVQFSVFVFTHQINRLKVNNIRGLAVSSSVLDDSLVCVWIYRLRYRGAWLLEYNCFRLRTSLWAV